MAAHVSTGTRSADCPGGPNSSISQWRGGGRDLRDVLRYQRCAARCGCLCVCVRACMHVCACLCALIFVNVMKAEVADECGTSKMCL